MLTQLRTEQLLTKLVLGMRVSPEECRRLRGYLSELEVQLEHWEQQTELVGDGSERA